MLKTTQRLVNKSSLLWWYVFKTSWACLQDVFARRLEDVLKMSWRRLENVLKTSLTRYSQTSWRHLEDECTRRIYCSWRRRLEDVLKTSSEDVWLIRIYSSSSRHLEDILKTSFEDEDERRLPDVFKKSSSRRMFAGLLPPPSYLMSKNPRLVRVNFSLKIRNIETTMLVNICVVPFFKF